MPRYLVERKLGTITDEQLNAAAETSQHVRERDFPAVGWEHSHVVRGEDGLVSYCVYSAPDAQAVRDHAAAAGLPADRVQEIHTDLAPR
jgi:Protein of unknown function (DUF4242)